MSIRSTKNFKSKPSLSLEFRSAFGEAFSENVQLSSFVSSRVGGVAEYVLTLTSPEELSEAGKFAATHGVEYRVVAGGTNILPSPVGFPGLIIINKAEGINFSHGSSVVVVSSGVNNQALLTTAASRDLGGIEFLSAVPGTIGGAVVTNAGYGNQFIGAFVKDVTVFITDGVEHKVVTINANELGFQPYCSLFLGAVKYQPIVLTVRLQLARLTQDEIMRRIRTFKKRQNLLRSNQAQICNFFRPPIETQPSLSRELRRLRYPNLNLDFHKGVVTGSPGKATALDFRSFLHIIRQTSEAAGVNFQDRLDYLGYWPESEEGNEIE